MSLAIPASPRRFRVDRPSARNHLKTEVEGQTNFLLVDGSGQEVGNVVVTVANPEPVRQGNKVVVHNKINNLAGYTNYICNPICFRVKDDMEGGDRVPLRNLFSQFVRHINQTINDNASARRHPVDVRTFVASAPVRGLLLRAK